MNIPKTRLLKYTGCNKEYLFAAPNNQKANAYLKEIADVCGIEKNLTFRIVLHTKTTTITLSNRMPIKSPTPILGHTNIKTIQLYAKITDIKLSHDVDNLDGKLNMTINSVK